MEHALAGEIRRFQRLPPHHLDANALAHRGGGIPHAPAAQVRAAALDGLLRFLAGDAAPPRDEARERVLCFGDELQLRGSALQPFSTTRTGNFDSAEQTMPCGPAMRA